MALSKGQYYAVKNSLSKKEKDLIAFYELQWHLRHNVPTIEEVSKYLKLSQVTVNYYLARQPVIKALEVRGIPFRQHTQEDLTATQIATAITMSNFADTRSNEEKLDQLGIRSATYYAWLNDPQFKNLVQRLAEENLNNINPVAVTELTKKIQAGEWNAIRFYLETTGAIQNNNTAPTEQLLQAFVEVIQKHVKDPEVMYAIAQDLKLAAANRTLEAVIPQQPAITADFVENDVELEEAKKKLGVI